MGVANPGALLKQLAQQFHRFKQEGKGKGPESTRNRRHEHDLSAIEAQFEALLARWVGDDAERAAWRDYFYHFGARPPEFTLAEPPLFKGVAETGREAALRSGSGGVYEVVVDGKVMRRLPSAPVLTDQRLHTVRIEGMSFSERFDAPGEALDALEEYVRDPAHGAPWERARELYEDGLIDPTFALTARGRRLIDNRRNGGGGVDLSI